MATYGVTGPTGAGDLNQLGINDFTGEIAAAINDILGALNLPSATLETVPNISDPNFKLTLGSDKIDIITSAPANPIEGSGNAVIELQFGTKGSFTFTGSHDIIESLSHDTAGSIGGDSITATGANDTIVAGAGHDTITAGKHSIVVGTTGDTLIKVNNATAIGGQGADTLIGSGHSLLIGSGNDSIQTTGGHNTIISEGSDTITSKGSDTIFAATGTDIHAEGKSATVFMGDGDSITGGKNTNLDVYLEPGGGHGDTIFGAGGGTGATVLHLNSVSSTDANTHISTPDQNGNVTIQWGAPGSEHQVVVNNVHVQFSDISDKLV